jgi:parallel beta-helix repeat protein
LLYLDGKSDITIDEGIYGQIIIINCNNITIKNQDITNTSIGVEILFSDNCNIINNNINHNEIGIFLLYSANIIINKNNFIKNDIDADYIIWNEDPYIAVNIWDMNYWDKRIFPIHPIIGVKHVHILYIWWRVIPIITFDWNPSNMIYEL